MSTSPPANRLPLTLSSSLPTANTDSRLANTGELVLIRGLPGSGKSTMGKILELAGYEHYEDDQYFMKKGVYQFKSILTTHAHHWCLSTVREALSQNKRVVVCNRFTRLRELKPYLTLTKKIRIIEAKGTWQNIHGTPAGLVARMARRWEELPPALLDLSC